MPRQNIIIADNPSVFGELQDREATRVALRPTPNTNSYGYDVHRVPPSTSHNKMAAAAAFLAERALTKGDYGASLRRKNYHTTPAAKYLDSSGKQGLSNWKRIGRRLRPVSRAFRSVGRFFGFGKYRYGDAFPGTKASYFGRGLYDTVNNYGSRSSPYRKRKTRSRSRSRTYGRRTRSRFTRRPSRRRSYTRYKSTDKRDKAVVAKARRAGARAGKKAFEASQPTTSQVTTQDTHDSPMTLGANTPGSFTGSASGVTFSSPGLSASDQFASDLVSNTSQSLWGDNDLESASPTAKYQRTF